MQEKNIDGKIYKLVTIRNRSKWIAEDGSAYNPYHINQKATIHLNNDGYPCFGGGIPVHLYVATAWVSGYFKGAEVNHKDFNRLNSNANNLEWVTHLYNIQYSAKYNSKVMSDARKGENNGRAVFSQEDINKIRNLHKQGLKTMEIVKIFYPDITFTERRRVWNRFDYVIKGKSWSHTY